MDKIKPKKNKSKKKAVTKKTTGTKLSLLPFHLTKQRWDQVAVLTEICEQLANSSMGLAYICREDERLPTSKSVYQWLSAEIKSTGSRILGDMYAHAKESQADYLADELIEIADDGTNDWMEKKGKDGENIGYELNGEHVQRSRIRVDVRKWIAAKLKPRVYGDKLEISGDPDRPLLNKTDEELLVIRVALQRKLSGP